MLEGLDSILVQEVVLALGQLGHFQKKNKKC